MFSGFLYNLDLAIFHMINSGFYNKILDFIMLMASWEFLTVSIIVFLVPALLVLFGGKKGRKIAILLIFAVLISGIFLAIVKDLVARPRPFLILDNIRVLSHASGYSFFSGHAMLASLFAVVLANKYGKSIIYFFIAAIICISRVYLGDHYPSDVIVGVIVGIIFGLAILKYENKIFYWLDLIANRLGLSNFWKMIV